MNMNTAQAVWLACHANARLNSTDWEPQELDQSVFEHCISVDFIRSSTKHVAGGDGVLVGTGPLEWIEYLAMSGTQRVTLSWHDRNEGLPSHISAAFAGGGGKWVIETHMEDQSVVSWSSMERFVQPEQPRFRLFRKSSAAPSGWQCLYTGIPSTSAHEFDSAFDQDFLSVPKQRFKECLVKIAQFAREQKLEFWAENFFDRANAALSDHGDDAELDFSLAPPGVLNSEARQILCAAQRSSVFGGMGSWNDQCIDEAKAESVYSQLSGDLYESMNRAVAAAVTSIGKSVQ